MNKLSKVLLVLIYLLLIVFLGFGIYFAIQGVFSTGLIGIGIFLIGAGLTVFLQFHMMNDEIVALKEGQAPKPRKQKKQRNVFEDPLMEVDAKLIKIGETNKTSLSGSVRLYNEEFHLDGLYPSSIIGKYSDISTLELRGDLIVLVTKYMMDETADESAFHISVGSALKRKALLQTWSKKADIEV